MTIKPCSTLVLGNSTVSPQFGWCTEHSKLLVSSLLNPLTIHHPGNVTYPLVTIWFNISLYLIIATGHLLNTIFRAVDDLSEFCQSLYEDVILIGLLIGVLLYRWRVDCIASIIHFMDTCFMTTDARILIQCHRKALATFFMFVWLFSTISTWMLFESLRPMSENEVKLRLELYGTEHPRRRLPMNMWIPGLDETESWTYELLFMTQVYISTPYMLLSYVCSIALIPMMAIHIDGQIKILCKYIKMLGHRHKDSKGNEIFYTNIEKNEFVLASDTLNEYSVAAIASTSYETLRGNISRKELKKLKAYERAFFKQLVRFHQKMLAFTNKTLTDISPLVLFVVVTNYFVFSLGLYQLTAYNDLQSKFQLFKFVSELTLAVIQFYMFCYSAELLDDCQARIRTSLYSSRWYACSRATRQDMCMILRRLRKENHPKFYQGVLVLCNAVFVRLVRVSYNVVNLIKFKDSLG
ncbi:hypothetical protein WDU94_002223 [Cyamophila willieti]